MLDIARLADDPADSVEWTVAAHNGLVPEVVASSSGLIATAGFDGNVRVWSADGKPVADLPVQLTGVPAMAFAPGTDTLYYEDGGEVIHRFTADPGELTELAQSMLTRGFTPEECTRYFPGEKCPSFPN